jgi:hypothetical protein
MHKKLPNSYLVTYKAAKMMMKRSRLKMLWKLLRIKNWLDSREHLNQNEKTILVLKRLAHTSNES